MIFNLNWDFLCVLASQPMSKWGPIAGWCAPLNKRGQLSTYLDTVSTLDRPTLQQKGLGWQVLNSYIKRRKPPERQSYISNHPMSTWGTPCLHQLLSRSTVRWLGPSLRNSLLYMNLYSFSLPILGRLKSKYSICSQICKSCLSLHHNMLLCFDLPYALFPKNSMTAYNTNTQF